MQILKICVEKKYPIAQIKDIPAFIQKVNADIAARKTKHKQQQEKKKEKEELSKKTKDTEEKEKKETPGEEKEETKKGDKSEKIKVLEKKQ